MKNLSPVWFLKSPIDVEHKYYILLNFLQSVNSEIKNNNLYSPRKRIFSLIKELEYFLKYESILIEDYSLMEDEDVEILDLYSQEFFSREEISEISRIIKNSLRILYRYANLGASLWKSMEDRIRIFNLEISDTDKETGITIFRNMSTNEIFPYWWKKTEIRIGEETKNGVILKKVPVLNNYYSMSYEFIVHETLDSLGIRDGSKYNCTIIEISEDFNLNSEIFMVAKEKFIQEMGGED